MAVRQEEEPDGRIAQVMALLHEGPKAERAAAKPFFTRYFQRMAADDVLAREAATLYGQALSLWHFAGHKPEGAARIRIYNPNIERDGWQSPHTAIEIVNDDMPFLVDSVGVALAGLNLEIHLLQHPLFSLRRNGQGKRVAAGGTERLESLMHIEIDAQSDPARLGEIAAVLGDTLADVRASVEDWGAMRDKLGETLAGLDAAPPPLGAGEVAEAMALLRWMADDNFTFLGYREYHYEAAPGEEPMQIAAGSGLGILRDPARRVMAGPAGGIGARAEVLRFLHRQELLIVTKANARATVHRAVPLDYIGVRRFDAAGKVLGERRFIGLFTSAAYNRNPRDIPLLRRKIRRIVERAGLAPHSHDGKALLNILETYPRDELFQIGEDELFAIANGILALQSRPRIRLFLRRDDFARFYSCLVFVPRERYDTHLRQRLAAILAAALGGRIDAYHTEIGDDPLARLHFIVALPPGLTPAADAAAIEAELVRAGRSWGDDLHEALVAARGEEQGQALLHRFANAFPPGYRERYQPTLALGDIDKMAALSADAPLGVDLYRPPVSPERALGLKLYQRGAPVLLSLCLPILEHMGLTVLEEHPFEIALAPGEPGIWLHDFHLSAKTPSPIDLAAVKATFESALALVWSGAMEDDGFNQLVLLSGLDAREVALLRAYCKYLRQTGIAFSQAYMEDTLAANPALARRLVELFHARFDPAADPDRAARQHDIEQAIAAALDQVASLDEDRILRSFLNLVQATLRTSFYQRDRAGLPLDRLSFKLASGEIAELPAPRPLVEIFVYAPGVEGIHLRGGRVARGGIRWSDRREDFRTEILGLMKAQMVKNAVIVPVGAKGGFVPKRPPVEGGREAVLADGIACYKTLIRGLLDLTDNLVGQRVVPPEKVVRHDGDDSYLVVAADKGTASFSDIANGISAEYGYWLGDAFASGGSAGYDHKAMGVTARGAFTAVKRHFRELGRDILREPFSVVGIGDMSGDVFGNGMLQSETIRLLAAFDHRHIFIDPDPDPKTSFAERRRLYDLPRSSWADYDAKLISKGGGIFERRAKNLTLSPEIVAKFDLPRDRLSPAELIRALLTASVDLLWVGGIGTYVKASSETQAEVGDHANDSLRVDGGALRAKVVGEGGNLGFTQRGRIEYALAGGRLNTDAVDNSAGVDCSDHEVNIKILLDAVVAEGGLAASKRNPLLADMTGEVASLVLNDNEQQTQTLSLMAAQGASALSTHARLMRDLEQRGRLDRAVEFLPDEAQLAARQAAGRGLTRPELAVLLAYAKADLNDALLKSDLPEDPYFAADLARYFPHPLRERFAPAISRHRLRREIIATSVANSMVNRTGVGFAGDVQEETEASMAAVARAYAAGREIFAMREVWREIEALDGKMPAALQSEMMLAGIALLRRAALWLLRQNPGGIDIGAAIAAYGPGVERLTRCLPQVLVPQMAARLEERIRAYVEHGAPSAIAALVARFAPLGAALDIVAVAATAKRPVEQAAELYFRLGEHLSLDWLREAAGEIATADYWQRLAVLAVVDDLDVQQRLLAAAVLRDIGTKGAAGAAGAADLGEAIAAWEKRQGPVLERLGRDIAEFTRAGSLDLARLTLANRHLRSLRGGR